MNPLDYVRGKRRQFGNWIGLRLLKLAYRVRLWVFRSGGKLQLLLLSKLKYQLRLADPEARSEGFDDTFDKVIHVAAICMSMPEVFAQDTVEQLSERQQEAIRRCDSIRQDYETHKNAIDGLVDSALRKEAVKATIAAYALVESFCADQASDDVAAKYYLCLAQKYDAVATSIDFDRLRSMARETRKELRSLRNQISDREAFKIALSSSDLRTLASLVSAFFLLSGYLYNYFLLGHFGIEVSKYFSLSDYLASSIEVVWSSAWGAAIALLFYFLGMHSASRKSFAELKMLKQRKDYVSYVLPVLLGVSSMLLYLTRSEQFYSAVFLFVITIAYPVVPLLSRRFFKEPTAATLAMLFIICFSGYMYQSVGRQIYSITHGDRGNTHYVIKFRSSVPIDGSRAILIDANSSFLFLRGRNGTIYIVPRDQVQYFSIWTEGQGRTVQKQQGSAE